MKRNQKRKIYIAIATGYVIYGLGKDKAEPIRDAKSGLRENMRII